MSPSSHFSAKRAKVIRRKGCLGCKGSWVQIPPRRPINPNTYQNNSNETDYSVFPDLARGDFQRSAQIQRTNNKQPYDEFLDISTPERVDLFFHYRTILENQK